MQKPLIFEQFLHVSLHLAPPTPNRPIPTSLETAKQQGNPDDAGDADPARPGGTPPPPGDLGETQIFSTLRTAIYTLDWRRQICSRERKRKWKLEMNITTQTSSWRNSIRDTAVGSMHLGWAVPRRVSLRGDPMSSARHGILLVIVGSGWIPTALTLAFCQGMLGLYLLPTNELSIKPQKLNF